MAIQVRQQTPPDQTKASGYKTYLRIEFTYACVYCDLWERELGGVDTFHVEHYNPDPALELVYRNLFYSCATCNSKYKKEYWPNAAQKYAGQVILNPCDFDLDVYLDKTKPEWVGLNDTGKWNIIKLRLSSLRKQEMREDRQRNQVALEMIERQIQVAETIIKKAKSKNNRQAELQATRTRDQLQFALPSINRRLTRRQDSDKS